MNETLKNLTPSFIIYVDGNRFSVNHESAVKLIQVIDRIDSPSSCRIRLADSDLSFADDELFSEGYNLSVHLGFKDDVNEVFNGDTVGLDLNLLKGGESSTTVHCMNGLHRLKRVRKHRVFSETNDSEILKTIADENQLSLKADNIGGDKLFLIQKDITDLDFVSRMARRYGCKFRVSDGTLYFGKESDTDEEEIILEWGKTLTDFSGHIDSSNLLTEVHVIGWNNNSGESIRGSALLSDVPPLGGSELGGTAVENAFGAAIMSESDKMVPDTIGAEALALDKLKRNSFTYVTSRGTCEGDYRIRAGVTLQIKEAGGRFSGEYFVREVQHQFHSTKGYLTHFVLVRNAV